MKQYAYWDSYGHFITLSEEQAQAHAWRQAHGEDVSPLFEYRELEPNELSAVYGHEEKT